MYNVIPAEGGIPKPELDISKQSGEGERGERREKEKSERGE